MSEVTTLYKEYFQKSKVFLFPQLGLVNKTLAKPKNTYLHIEGNTSELNLRYPLYVCYDKIESKEFEKFERSMFAHHWFVDFIEQEADVIYVFDCTEIAKDYELVTEGKYSKTSDEFKKKILARYTNTKKNLVYVNSYLNPDAYYEMYARILNCDIKILKEVGELCSKPDTEQETIKVLSYAKHENH